MGLIGGHVDQRLHLGARELPPMTRDVVVFLDDFHGVIDVVLIAFNAQPVVVQVRADMQRVFEQAHIFIQRAEEGFNLPRNVNSTAHSDGGASCGENDLANGWFLFEETPNTLTQQSAGVKLQVVKRF